MGSDSKLVLWKWVLWLSGDAIALAAFRNAMRDPARVFLWGCVLGVGLLLVYFGGVAQGMRHL